MAFKEVPEPGRFGWGAETPVGTQVVGILTDFQTREYMGNPRSYAVVQQRNGEQISFPCPTVLASRMQQVPMGCLIRVTYKGPVPMANGSTYKDFLLEVDDGQPEAAAPVQAGVPAPVPQQQYPPQQPVQPAADPRTSVAYQQGMTGQPQYQPAQGWPDLAELPDV